MNFEKLPEPVFSQVSPVADDGTGIVGRAFHYFNADQMYAFRAEGIAAALEPTALLRRVAEKFLASFDEHEEQDWDREWRELAELARMALGGVSSRAEEDQQPPIDNVFVAPGCEQFDTPDLFWRLDRIANWLDVRDPEIHHSVGFAPITVIKTGETVRTAIVALRAERTLVDRLLAERAELVALAAASLRAGSTDERLVVLSEKATAGEFAVHHDRIVAVQADGYKQTVARVCGTLGKFEYEVDNAHFIAAACNFARTALEKVRP